jgi:diguanylate cyclase (GGDEF)-like protein/putative nucleotidyltransferase with HDIG domain
MSVKARSYILGVILAGMALSAWALPSLAALNTQWPIVLILVVLTTLAHLFVLMGIGNDAWVINLVFLFAGVVLLQPFEFVILVVVPHLIEWAADLWVKKSARLRNWYIQPFNIAAHLISGFAARGTYVSLTLPETPLFVSTAFLAAMSAVIVYVGLNHLLIAVVLMLARGKTLRQTGMFELGNLFGDLVQTSLGYLWAVFWNLNPWLMLPVLAPLIVIYRALTIPKLKQDAQTDAKTGLFNARYFAEALAAEFEKARRSGQPLSVIMADLDLLRSINNTYGHLAGDTVLIGVARVIRETAGDSGIAGRFGGEEFSVILPRLTEAEARAVAERMRQTVDQVEFQVDNHPQPIHVTLSLGVAEYSTELLSAKDLVHEADVAVYQAKFQGRNRVVCASAVPRSVKLESQASDARLESPYVAPFTPRPAVAEATGVATNGVVTNAQPEAQSRSQTAPAPANPAVPSRSAASGRLGLFVGCVIVAGLITAALGLRLDSPTDYWAMALFTLLAGLAEFFQMDLYGDGSISVSLAISFAAALVAGIPGVIATSAVISLVHALRRRGALYKTAFNWSNHVLAALAPVLLIRVQGITLQISNLLLLSVLASLAALGYFGIETGLIAGAIGLSEKRSPVAVWQDQYRWLLPYYLLLGLMGAFLSLAYITLGVPGVLVFTFPILMMRFAEKQYIDRTQESGRELKRMNQELTLANSEIASASRAIRQLNDELFLTLSKVIDARDPDAAGHAVKVADYATAIAVEVGLVERVEQIRQAALLHDIGKLGITERILHKPARLDAEEYAIIKTHTALGAEFLETCQGLRHLAPFVKHHHEWWDGDGYPDGLRGEQIPIEARILAVCDAVDAMGSDRPYHQAIALDEIVAELERCAEAQFDPAVVQAFIRIAKRGGENFTSSTQEMARPSGSPSGEKK